MDVDLTPELEQLVRSKVQAGHYHSASEVIQDALRLLEHYDGVTGLRKDEIRSRIEKGWLAAKSGDLADGDEVFDRIEAELDAIERSGTSVARRVV